MSICSSDTTAQDDERRIDPYRASNGWVVSVTVALLLLLSGCSATASGHGPAASGHGPPPAGSPPTTQHTVATYCDQYVKSPGCLTRRRVHGGNAPPACAPECVEYSRADLSGVSLTLYFAPQASVLEAAASSGPPSWQVRRGESPVYLLCNSGAPAPQCVVYDNFGHGSSLTTYLISGKALKPTPSITSDGPAAFVADLNADGYLDATLEQADEDQPGYGYWQTYVFNGRAFVSTGCGGKKKHLGTRPAKPETGSCPR